MNDKLNRRSFFKKSMVASAGATLAWQSLEEKVLMAELQGKPKPTTPAKTDNSTPSMPMGKIGDLQISRLICGGNLVGGYAHSRDLIYVSSVLEHYFTPEKIFETWRLSEEHGVNTMVLDVRERADKNLNLVQRYWKQQGGKIQFIGQCNPKSNDIQTTLKVAVDNGAVGIFIQGGVGDNWVKNQRVDLLGKAVDFIRQNGLVAGLAGHSLHVPVECEKAGIHPDFYVKTFHRDDYWSATPKENRKEFLVDISASDNHNQDHDNMWCINPAETAAFMSKVKKPWIAYKVLAAGAIHPKEGFDFAFKHGADFVLAGMFDFQVIENAGLAGAAAIMHQSRTRPWCA
jgi:hypothetical protein